MNANAQNGPATHSSSRQPARKGGTRAKWFLPLALLLLSAIPLIAGAYRLSQLAGGAEITPANARFFASPIPVVIHIIASAIYAVLGAFQFSTAFRRRAPGWHRRVGRLLLVCGLLVGGSGLWMTLFYPRPENSGDLLFAIRLFFGSGMIAAIILSFTTIRRGNVNAHRAWTARAYAIGLGAGTQVLTIGFGEAIAGTQGATGYALLMGAAWVINLAVAEWATRRRAVGNARPAPVALPWTQ